MTVTYVGDLSTSLDKVRFEIGDRVSGTGPRPDGTNFTDAELNALVTLDGSWQAAAAHALEVLANEWAAAAGSVGMADYREDYTARAEAYRKRAQDVRVQYGLGPTVLQPSITRVDGFSDNITAEEV